MKDSEQQSGGAGNLMEQPSVKQRSRHTARPEALILVGGIASAIVLYLFMQRGGSAFMIALGLTALAAAAIAVQFPLLGLAAISAITVGNVSENLIVHFGAPSIAKLIGPGLAVIFALRFIFYRSRPFVDPLTVSLFAVYIGMIGLSMLYAFDWQTSQGAMVSYTKDIVVVLLTLAFFNRPGALKVFVWALLIPSLLICLLGIYKVSFGDPNNQYFGFATTRYVEQRYAGPILDPNYYGAVLVFLLPLAAGKAVFGGSITERVFGSLAGLAFAIGVGMTGSRGAVVAAMASFCIFLLILDRRALVYVSAVGSAAVAVVLVAFSEELLSRFELVFDPFGGALQQDISVEGRLASWTVAMNLFFENPLLGVGAGNFNLFYQDYALQLGLIFRGEGRSTHSLYLEVLSELGLVGLTIFLVLLGNALIGVIRACRKLAAAGLQDLRIDFAVFGIGLFGYLVAMVFLHDAYPRLLWTIVAVGIATPRIAQVEIGARTGAP